MADVTVDQAKLVMNAFAATFQNNLVAADLVTWKQYDSEMDDRNGLTVVEQIGPRYNVTETTNGVADLTAGVQGTVFGSEQFKVNKTFGSSMGYGDFVKIRDINDARESVALTNAATNLAEKIDAYVLNAAVLMSNNWLGDPAEPVGNYSDFVSGYTRLKEEGVSDANLRAILTYADRQALSEWIVELPAPDAEATKAFRGGFQGQINGIPTLFTQQLPVIQAGTRTTVTVNGGSQNVNYSDVAISGAPGQYMSQLLNVTVAAGQTIKAGEVFTIAGVYAYDNRSGSALDHLQQFTVVTGTTGPGSIRIFPALIVPGTGTGDDAGINNAHATVSATPAGSAAITFVGAANSIARPRAIIQKEALVVNTAQLILPNSGKAHRKSLTKVPLSVRMWADSDFNTGDHKVRFDVALTANVRDRRRVVRINGTGA